MLPINYNKYIFVFSGHSKPVCVIQSLDETCLNDKSKMHTLHRYPINKWIIFQLELYLLFQKCIDYLFIFKKTIMLFLGPVEVNYNTLVYFLVLFTGNLFPFQKHFLLHYNFINNKNKNMLGIKHSVAISVIAAYKQLQKLYSTN